MESTQPWDGMARSARSIVIITFTVISICGFVLETDRGLYEMKLGCPQSLEIGACKSGKRRESAIVSSRFSEVVILYAVMRLKRW